MRLNGRRESSNFEDRRGMSGGQKVAGMGIGGLIIAGIISLLMGGNPLDLLQQMGGLNVGETTEVQGEYQSTPEEEEQVKFLQADTCQYGRRMDKGIREHGTHLHPSYPCRFQRQRADKLRWCHVGSWTILLLCRPETVYRPVLFQTDGDTVEVWRRLRTGIRNST